MDIDLINLSPGIFPEGIRKIKFGRDYNQPLSPGIFQESVKSLVFGANFLGSLDGALPQKLKHLRIDGYYLLNLHNLPDSIEELNVSTSFRGKITFPLSIKKFKVAPCIVGNKSWRNYLMLLYKKDRRLNIFREKRILSIREKNYIYEINQRLMEK